MLQKTPSHTRNIRSSSYTIPLLNRPAHSKATLGNRTISVASSVWNSIPNDFRCAPSLSSFKSRLKTYLFRSVYKDLTFSLITVHMCMIRLVIALLMTFLAITLIRIKLINHDCLSILMLLCIILRIMLAYLMLLAALSNAVCLHNAYVLPFIFSNAFCLHALPWYTDT